MPPHPQAPRWIVRFLEWFCRPDLLEHILGDLEEAFEDNLEEMGERKAKRRFVFEVLGLFRLGIIRNLKPSYQLTPIAMLLLHLKIALRQFKKYKLFASLNIFGLATSMSVCLLLIMILADQYSYDEFHEKKDSIYRVISSGMDRPINQATFATAPTTVADALDAKAPGVAKTVRVITPGGSVLHQKKLLHAGGMWVDQAFLNVFSFGWTEGDQSSALTKPFSMVITEEMAENYFSDKNPIGEVVNLPDYGDFLITGILPKVSRQSHLRFDYLISFSTVHSLERDKEHPMKLKDWDSIYRSSYVYYLLDEEGTVAEADARLAEIAADRSLQKENEFWYFESQNVAQVSPGNDLSNDMNSTPKIVMYFLISLGILIILTACFNYTNLSLARAIRRSREIGVRKVVGARRRQIIWQFVIEAILISLLSLGVAVILLEFLIRGFYNLDSFIPQHFHLTKTVSIYLVFVLFSIVVGLLAGLLPAWRLSTFKPLEVLKKGANLKVFSRFNLRKMLVVSQFALSTIFVLTTLIILSQQRHVFNMELGFDKNNILNVYLYETDYDLFKQRMSQISQVEAISGASVIPVSGEVNKAIVFYEDRRDSMEISYNFVTTEWIDNLGITLLAGENIPEKASTQNEQFVILNEKAIERMGFNNPKEALGQTIELDTALVSVIGVVKDFYYDNIWQSNIAPHMLRYNPQMIRTANVKISSIDQRIALQEINKEWAAISPEQSLNAYFFDDRIYHILKFFKMGSKIVGSVGILAIIIACLGLLGMVTYSVQGKIKEVGIRKVLGASEGNLVWFLSKSFVLLLGIGIAMAVPLSILLNNFWLQNFTRRISISPFLILLGVGFIFSLALFTVVSRTWRAAKSNPVGMLGTE